MLRSALTVAAGVLLTAGLGTAADPIQKLGTYTPSADDTQDIGGHHYRGYYGGYRGYYGGYRPSFYYGGFGGYRPAYYGGYYGYRPGFSFSYYSAPSFYYGGPAFYYPRPAFGYSYYGFAPISDRPAVTLTLSLRPREAVPAAPLPPQPADGTFRYDGGPAVPVPMPPAEAPPAVRPGLPEPKSDTLNIAMTGRTAVAPKKPANRYPAYGEKR